MSNFCPKECFLKKTCKCGKRICRLMGLRVDRKGEKTVICSYDEVYFDETGSLCKECKDEKMRNIMENDNDDIKISDLLDELEQAR